MTSMRIATLLGAAVALAACSQKFQQPRIDDMTAVQPNLGTTSNSQRADTEAAGRRADSVRAAIAQQSSGYHATALSTCSPDVCAALGRSEMAIGMNRAAVFAVTNSMPEGWTIRGTESMGSMMPVQRNLKDRVSEVAMVSFRDGRVISYTYRETQGLRTVAAREDATMEGRRRAQANSLLEQGDQLVAAGRSDEALARYDQADVVDPNNPGTTLRIAKLLDQQLRPVEALMRYQKFLHEMEIDRINARGRANAELAGAVVAAQARVVHLVETTNRRP